MRCRLVITPIGETLVRGMVDIDRLPRSFYDDLLADAEFDLAADAEQKLRPCGAPSERQFTIAMPAYGVTVWFRLEIDRQAHPTEARILDCRHPRLPVDSPLAVWTTIANPTAALLRVVTTPAPTVCRPGRRWPIPASTDRPRRRTTGCRR
jgi:hypothetical protein